MGKPVQKISTFWPLLKLQFFGLKMIVFYLKYPEMIFSDIIAVKNTDKKRFDFWRKRHGLIPIKNVLFLTLFKTSSFST